MQKTLKFIEKIRVNGAEIVLQIFYFVTLALITS